VESEEAQRRSKAAGGEGEAGDGWETSRPDERWRRRASTT